MNKQYIRIQAEIDAFHGMLEENSAMLSFLADSPDNFTDAGLNALLALLALAED